MARGDHLYFYLAGGGYSHHGLDCGDGTVIHYELSPWMKLAGCFSSANPPKIARTTLADFSLGNEVLVRTYFEESAVDDVDKVIRRAESRLGEQCYDVFGNNCEHFIVWCKTGEANSSQVTAHRQAAATVLKGSVVGAFLLRAARRAPGRYRAVATLGAIGVAGAVYVGTYIQHRLQNRNAGLS